jgi:cytochrome c556
MLLVRKPGKDADEWAKYSAASRDAGAELFKAAKAKDAPSAKKAYEAMLGHCNACHKKFEDGKHILAP